ncbi:MAG: 2-amino-4-hydroxy-6-hydroxymethyldihydropteridine diphosphokinase [Prevotellaceae bacterium]|jgi:2-amino-4-hydroxy-6-hydroxymethyldihydropteridine diphosphokinase|nr:2-amino-4-hydroxy-6-hydroxymethyldihydropteridine diphosphokinase [Prevotellaceae bacterium]
MKTNKSLHSVFFLNGSNLGDRIRFLEIAEQSLCQHIGRLVARSSVYESEPWGFSAEQNFLNQVLIIETELNPHEILETAGKIETENGRIRSGNGYSSRTLDIDILYYDSLILNTPDLQIPHRRLHERRFALLPLCEIAPQFLHPVLKLTSEQMLHVTN